MTPLRAEPRFADSGDARDDAALALADGRACAAIAERDPAERARRVREAVRALEAAGARVTLTGNPLRTPLTVERLILRVGGDDGLDPATLIEEAASGAFADLGRAVLAVEQAETLDAGAFAFLSALSRTLRDRKAAFQLLFAGDERLPGLLRAHGFTVPEPAPGPAGAPPAPAAQPAADRSARGRRLVVAAAGAAVLVSVAVAAALLVGDAPGSAPIVPGPVAPAPVVPAPIGPAPIQPSAAEPPPQDAQAAQAQPSATAPAGAPADAFEAAPPPPPVPAAPPASAEERDAALQRDFEAFLDTQGTQTAQLTPPQRAELFKAYVAWRSRRDPPQR